MTPKRIFALAALAVILVVVGFLILNKQNTKAAEPLPETGSSPTTTSAAAPKPTQQTSAAAAVAERDADRINAAVESFVKEYSGQRWDDPTRGAWIDRAAVYMTTNYAREIHEKYSGAGGAAWEEFVQQRQVRTPAIRRADISTVASDKATVVVSYTVTTTSSSDPSGRSQDFTKLLTLRPEAGDWKVAGTADLVSGYAPPTAGKMTPEPAPTVGH